MRTNLFLFVNILLYFKFGFGQNARNVRKSDSVDLASLAAFPQGSELYMLENLMDKRKSYQLEDFFWTGSGDGGYDENIITHFPDLDIQNTMYTTKTIFSTVYIDSSPTVIPNQSEVINASCSTCTTVSGGDISPTRTYPGLEPGLEEEEDEDEQADAQFWIVTVLKSDGTIPVIKDIRHSLAKLYKIAFQRQQKHHLLGENLRKKREDKPKVKVTIHKFGNVPDGTTDSKMEILYHVSLYGRPVDPITASADMTLVTDQEVQQELGYPFLIKAEPYIKLSAAEHKTANTQQAWLIISTVIASVLILLVIVALLSFCLNNRKQRRQRGTSTVTTLGRDNAAFVVTEERDDKGRLRQLLQPQLVRSGGGRGGESPTYVNYAGSGDDVARSGGSSSGSSCGKGMDVSPLVVVKQQQKQKQQKKGYYRPRAAINRTVPLNDCFITDLKPDRPTHKRMSTTSTSSSCSGDSSSISCRSGGATSYLSMPSVKEFPRPSGHPEPLSRVLEPLSVMHLDHLDAAEEEDVEVVQGEVQATSGRMVRVTTPTLLPRMHSMGTASDPGVVNPIIWQQLQQVPNVSKMRKRFHNLLDDTFSLFGATDCAQSVRSHSAIFDAASTTSSSRPEAARQQQRPTSCAPRAGLLDRGRRGAWEDGASPRPGSAPVHVDVLQVRAEGRLSPSDPAGPLIAAIKTEIGRCRTPGDGDGAV